MLVATNTVAAPATTTTTPLYFDPPYDHQTLPKPTQRSFKKHKVLPRPRIDGPASTSESESPSDFYELSSNPSITANPEQEPAVAPRPPQDLPATRLVGPDLPPTPPGHSRASPGSYPIRSASPPATEDSAPTVIAAGSITPVPGTPTLQNSPPTPDVTPPQVGRRPKAFRPVLTDRIPSKATADSRSESFKTARESPGGSDDENTTPRPTLQPSRDVQHPDRQQEPELGNSQDAEFGLGLELDDELTPKTRQEFSVFDGEWTSNSDVEQEWDYNLFRNVTVRKRRRRPRTNGRGEVIEDVTVAPTNATKALRSAPLQERIYAVPSPQPSPPESTSKDKSRWTESTSESSISTDPRRSSGMSSKSTVSTVVEAILVDVPPQRQKTLRHVRKQNSLRDSSSEFPRANSASTSVRQTGPNRRPQPAGRLFPSRTDSMASTGTTNSIRSKTARREIWRNGGIPVVVIPDRRESLKPKPSGPPSLRSTNSHSKRSNSMSSVPRSSFSGTKELSAFLDKASRRGRAMSITYGSFPNDQLTMDYPPIVPRRRSSLSAPTSRNTSRAGSRAGSLTAESLKAHNALIEQDRSQPPQTAVERVSSAENASGRLGQRQPHPAPSIESHKNEISNLRPLVDCNGDPFFGKRLTTHNTPFSQASIETNGTHSVADIAEAMAVNIYPHQNKSVLMVHHMSKPVTITNEVQLESLRLEPSEITGGISGNPEIVTSGPDGGPVTPPQPQFSMDGVDSPLRNPRAPPEPPAIKFIPATPSGLTPAGEKEKMLGNFFEGPQRRPSLVRRAFSLRKASDNVAPSRPGFIARTLSLSRSTRKNTIENPDFEERNKQPALRRYPTADDPPPDEAKLHPFWRPSLDQDVDTAGFVYDPLEHTHQDDDYSPLDKRFPRRRSLSERMRRTFAIPPIEDDDHYITTDRRSPERRTIKRTPSGNLRVTPHRDSFGSVRRSGSYVQGGDNERPSTAPEESGRRIWGAEKRVDDRGRRLFPNWQDKLEQYKPQNLQRRLSEHRRQKRTDALRQKISGPREVRDGVGEVIKRRSYGGPSYQSGSQACTSNTRHSRAYDPAI